ncbi:MAG TPA: 30S ribosome-binding factor RbfA [Terriglobia bacterium]|nr:30S ribosome-binding factor RbfA [Terriglobia bacterium]
MKRQDRRSERVGEMIRLRISTLIIRELRDPRIGMTTVTGVKMSPDLKQARVFVSVLGNEEDRRKSLQGLNSAAAHIRHQIGLELRLKNTPELTFVYDSSIEYGARIEELLQQLKHSADLTKEDEEN